MQNVINIIIFNHLLLSSKIHLFLSLRNFPQMFSCEFFEKIFCLLKHFVEKEKDGNPLAPGQLNMVDQIEKIILTPIFFPARFLWNMVLCYYKKHNISVIDECEAFSERIFLQDSCRIWSCVIIRSTIFLLLMSAGHFLRGFSCKILAEYGLVLS